MLELQAPRCIRVFLWSDGLGKKEKKKKKRKKDARKKKSHSALAISKRGMLGFDYLSLQVILDRSVQIHNFWHCR